MSILELTKEDEDYLKEHALQKKYGKAKALFEDNPNHPSLNIEVLEPKHLKIYSFRIDHKYRAVFIIRGGNAQIIKITNHYK